MAEAARRPAIDGSLWTELTTEERAAATVLQYEEASWDAGETPFVCSVPWNQLSTCEQSAAVVLGYDEESWKRELDASLEQDAQDSAVIVDVGGGWESVSTSHSGIYYFHAASGRTSWTLPESGASAAALTEPPSADSSHGGGEVESAPAPADSPSASALHPEPLAPPMHSDETPPIPDSAVAPHPASKPLPSGPNGLRALIVQFLRDTLESRSVVPLGQLEPKLKRHFTDIAWKGPLTYVHGFPKLRAFVEACPELKLTPWRDGPNAGEMLVELAAPRRMPKTLHEYTLQILEMLVLRLHTNPTPATVNGLAGGHMQFWKFPSSVRPNTLGLVGSFTQYLNRFPAVIVRPQEGAGGLLYLAPPRLSNADERSDAASHATTPPGPSPHEPTDSLHAASIAHKLAALISREPGQRIRVEGPKLGEYYALLSPSDVRLIRGYTSHLLRDAKGVRAFVAEHARLGLTMEGAPGHPGSPGSLEIVLSNAYPKLKTVMCWSVTQGARCMRGSECTFAHSRDELRLPPPQPHAQPHPAAPAQPPPAAPAQPPPAAPSDIYGERSPPQIIQPRGVDEGLGLSASTTSAAVAWQGGEAPFGTTQGSIATEPPGKDELTAWLQEAVGLHVIDALACARILFADGCRSASDIGLLVEEGELSDALPKVMRIKITRVCIQARNVPMAETPKPPNA